MKRMRSWLVLVVGLTMAGAPALLADGTPAKGEWTGYITDGHCGAKGATKDHTADCVEKCIKSGTKAQIWIDADKKGIDLDGFDKVKPFMGSKVTVKGTLDAKTHTILVESAQRAAQ